MAEYTANYRLKKPDRTDYYNVADFNANSDIIDKYIKQNFDESKSYTDSKNTETKDWAVNTFSNPNLFYNPNFLNPVNQRGQTTYTGINAYTYTIDRWRIASTAAKVVFDAEGCHFSKTADNISAQFGQVICDTAGIEGNPLTLSANVGGKVYTLSVPGGWIYPTSGGKTTIISRNIVNSLAAYVYAGIDKNIEVIFYYPTVVPAGAENLLKYAKLELGSVATPFVPRPYVEELQDCLMHNKDNEIVMPFSNPNLIIGGDFSTNPWQRGTNFAVLSAKSATYTADRFRLFSQGACDVVKDGIWIKTTIGNNNTGVNTQATVLEIPESLLGETVTLSFYAKADTEIKSGIYIWNGNSITTAVAKKDITLTTSAKRYVLTFKIPENLIDNLIYIWFTRIESQPGMTVWLGRCKLELGSVATPFIPRPYAEELALCQHYYYQSWNGNIGTAGIITREALAANRLANVELPCTMRKTPTIKIFDSSGTENSAKEWVSSSPITLSGAGYVNNKSFIPTVSNNAATAGKTYAFHYSTDAEIY